MCFQIIIQMEGQEISADVLEEGKKVPNFVMKILQSLAFYVKLINAKHFSGNNNVRDYRRYIN